MIRKNILNLLIYLKVVLYVFLSVATSPAQQKFDDLMKVKNDSIIALKDAKDISHADSTKKYRHNIVSVVMFGLTGLFAGTAIGSEIDPPSGEAFAIYSDGKAVGAIIGTIVGVSVGYHLGKEEIKSETGGP